MIPFTRSDVASVSPEEDSKVFSRSVYGSDPVQVMMSCWTAPLTLEAHEKPVLLA